MKTGFATVAPADIVAAMNVVQSDLERVEEILASALKTDSPSVQRLIQHAAKYGGKRIRPALLFLSARASGTLQEQHDTLGAVVELIHLATLLHDDVLDHSTTRRSVRTLNAEFGNQVSILLGDIVYAAAYTLTNSLEDRTAARYLANTTLRLCTGEIEQNFSSGRWDLGLEEYFRIIEFKTASLISACTALGAYYARAGERRVHAMEEYGRLIGIAFQIIDDCLDLVGEEKRVGKDLGTDLDEGKLTLPVIHLLGRLPRGEVETLRGLLEDAALKDRRQLLRQRFDLEPDLEYTRGVARSYVEQALAHLAELPDSVEKDALTQLARFVLTRDR